MAKSSSETAAPLSGAAISTAPSGGGELVFQTAGKAMLDPELLLMVTVAPVTSGTEVRSNENVPGLEVI